MARHHRWRSPPASLLAASLAAWCLAAPLLLPPAALLTFAPPCNGGWQGYDPDALPTWLAARSGETSFSDMPVHHSVDEAARCADASRPFTLRGCAAVLGRRPGLARGELLTEAGELQVSVGYSWSIARNGGEGPWRLPLREYLAERMHARWEDGAEALEPAYAFGPAALPGLPDASDLPPLLAPAGPTMKLTMLGAAGSAVGWHRHGAAVQMTVYGWKRWMFYPLGRYPPGDGPGGGFSSTDWLRVIYPTLRGDDLPLELVQQPGDVVYVPPGWYHAVVNLADSVAVSFQSAEPLQEEDPFKSVGLADVEGLSDADRMELAQAAQRHLEERGGLHALRTLFYVLRASQPREATELMLQGVAADPWHVPLQFELAQWLAQRASDGDEDALQDLKRAVRSWEPQLRANMRNLKALWILSKYYKFAGEAEESQRLHSRLLELHERGIDR